MSQQAGTDWTGVKEVFDAAARRPESERAEFVQQARNGDVALAD